MHANRTVILGAVGLVCLVIFAWNWISGWGLVTVDVVDARLSDVIRSIERQGGVKILTRVDPETPVSMDVYRVPPVEAVEVLAGWLDGQWSVAYVAAPAKDGVARGIDVLAMGGRGDSEFRRISYPTGMMGVVSESVPDPRKIEWIVSPMESQSLQGYLDQAAQKTGVMIAIPAEWNPDLARMPKSGAARSAIPAAISAVGGQSREVFLINVWGGWGGGEPRSTNAEPGERGGGDAPLTGRTTSGGTSPQPEADNPRPAWRDRPEPNPEWVAERVRAEIAQLPASERDEALNDFEEMRAFWTEVRALPDDQRRAAVEQYFDNPAVQARMERREIIRDGRRSPERRADRYRRYVDRKNARKSS